MIRLGCWRVLAAQTVSWRIQLHLEPESWSLWRRFSLLPPSRTRVECRIQTLQQAAYILPLLEHRAYDRNWASGERVCYGFAAHRSRLFAEELQIVKSQHAPRLCFQAL